MYSILLLQVSAIISETKKLGWAFLQTVSLPTLKCLVPSGKTKHKNQTISSFSCFWNKWTRQIRRSVCIWNEPACHQIHANLHIIYTRGQNSVWPGSAPNYNTQSAPTCWSLSFSCLARRCLLFFGPAGRCRAADDTDPESPFRGSLSAPAAGSRWGPCSSWNNQPVLTLMEVELSLYYMILYKSSSSWLLLI